MRSLDVAETWRIRSTRWSRYEKQLEIQKAKEDAARLAAIKEQEKEDTSTVVYVPTDSDQYLLGAIIQCEAGGESYDGKLAVGSVVMNRVKSSYFPNSVSGVIYQSGTVLAGGERHDWRIVWKRVWTEAAFRRRRMC